MSFLFQASRVARQEFQVETRGLRDKLQQQLADTQHARATAELAAAKLSKLQADVQSKTHDLAAAATQRATLQAQVASLTATVADLRGQVGVAVGSGAQERERAAALAKELAACEDRAVAAEGVRDAHAARVASLDALSASLQAKLDARAAEFGALQAQVAELQAAAVVAQDDIDLLTGQRNAATKKAGSLAKRMAKLMQESTPSPEVETVQHEKNELLVAAQVARHEVKQLQEELQAYKEVHGVRTYIQACVLLWVVLVCVLLCFVPGWGLALALGFSLFVGRGMG